MVLFVIQFSSVAQSCLTLYNPMDHSTQSLPVHHQLLEFTQTHVHWVSDTIQPSYPLSSPSLPAFNLFQHQGLFKWVSSLHQLGFVFRITSSSVYFCLLSVPHPHLILPSMMMTGATFASFICGSPAPSERPRTLATLKQTGIKSKMITKLNIICVTLISLDSKHFLSQCFIFYMPLLDYTSTFVEYKLMPVMIILWDKISWKLFKMKMKIMYHV